MAEVIPFHVGRSARARASYNALPAQKKPHFGATVLSRFAAGRSVMAIAREHGVGCLVVETVIREALPQRPAQTRKAA